MARRPLEYLSTSQFLSTSFHGVLPVPGSGSYLKNTETPHRSNAVQDFRKYYSALMQIKDEPFLGTIYCSFYILV